MASRSARRGTRKSKERTLPSVVAKGVSRSGSYARHSLVVSPARETAENVPKVVKVVKVRLKEEKPGPSGPSFSGQQAMVTVEVSPEGTEKQSFLIHKNFICHYSPYFDAAFNGDFAEALSQKVTLTDTSPKTFGIFVNWLYSQTVVDDNGAMPSSTDIISLWILGDKILAPKLQNHAIKTLSQSHLGETIDAIDFFHVYENTASKSPLRSFLVEACATVASFTISPHDAQRYPHAMLVDTVNAMRALQSQMRQRKTGYKKPVEHYYIAEDVSSRH